MAWKAKVLTLVSIYVPVLTSNGIPPKVLAVVPFQRETQLRNPKVLSFV
jgi:hypothetical protein